MNEMKIPNKADWENYLDDLDTKYAYKQFFGKSNEQMQTEFKRNVLERKSDISWMPIKPFQYYIFGLCDYVLKKDFGFFDNSDAASVYLNLILDTLEKKPNFVIPIFDQLKDSISYVAENQALYDADEDIYGSFFELRKKIFQLAGQH
jgi:hypothetical protein